MYANTEKYYPNYFKSVKDFHEIAGTNSIGWQYKWSSQEP